MKEILIKHKDTLTTTEWLYNGIWLDGFWRRYCTVVEAKGNYEWMFPAPPKRGPRFAHILLNDWAQSYEEQLFALASAKPRAQLEWHFMQEPSWLQARRIGIDAARFTPPPN